jgi:hydrogenase/urease accessory protein HupE
MRTPARLLLAAATLLASPGSAAAHATSTGLARITVEGNAIAYRLTLVLGELPEAPRRLLAAAADGDGPSAERIAAEVRERVTLRAGGAACWPGRVSIRGSRLDDGRVELELFARCPAAIRTLAIQDDWPSFLGDHHRTLARLEGAAGPREIAFSRDQPRAEVDLRARPPAGGVGFFRLGLDHILSGWDHLLFLAALILRGGSLLSLLRIVTAFTVAHSITLALAALGVVVVPGAVVEPAIAASIVWVALENLRARDAPSRRWLVSFGFGLVHGLGFASALQELSLPPGRLAWALVGFNLGVEAGQGVVLLAAFPVLLWLRRASWEPVAVRAASVAVSLAGMFWLVQRLFFV